MKLSPTTKKILGAIWIGLGIWGIVFVILNEKQPIHTTQETIESLIAPVGLIVTLAVAALYKFLRPSSIPNDPAKK